MILVIDSLRAGKNIPPTRITTDIIIANIMRPMVEGKRM